MAWNEIIAAILLFSGAFFTLTGALGMLRFPDFYTRLHPAGIKDALGAPLVLLGLAVLSGGNLITIKILLLIAFLVITSPTSTHALAKSALSDGNIPLGNIDEDVPLEEMSVNSDFGPR